MAVGEILVDDLLFPEQVAFALSQAAVKLDNAMQHRDRIELLVDALNNNLELWVAISTMTEQPDCNLSDEIKNNLVKLGKFVSDTTMINGKEIEDQTIETLINVDLQISEGLLEGAKT